MLTKDIETKIAAGWLVGYETGKAPWWSIRSPDQTREIQITRSEHDFIVRHRSRPSVWFDRPTEPCRAGAERKRGRT
jgi:hypothetical protein